MVARKVFDTGEHWRVVYLGNWAAENGFWLRGGRDFCAWVVVDCSVGMMMMVTAVVVMRNGRCWTGITSSSNWCANLFIKAMVVMMTWGKLAHNLDAGRIPLTDDRQHDGDVHVEFF